MKKFVSGAINQCGMLVRKFAFRSGIRTSRVVVLSPSWEGSIGDEAVIKASTDYLVAEMGYTVDLLTFNEGSPYQQAKSITSFINIPDYFETGGWWIRIRLILILAKYERFILLGTDSLDGHYTEWQSNGLMVLANQAAKSGIPTTIAGISIQASPKLSSVTLIKKISDYSNSLIFIRDEISRDRILSEVPRACLTADPAFLLNPSIDTKNSELIRIWADERRSEGALLIAVNISSHAVQSLDGNTSGNMEDSFVEAINRICGQTSQALGILIIPHDFRKHCDDLEICRSIYNKLKYVANCQALVYEPPVTASSVKALVVKMDYVFSGRMHLAIAALGAGVPVGCVTYQGKFEGLFRHFGLDGCTITPEEALDSSNLASFLKRGILGRVQTAAAIAERLPRVMELAKENFK